jgi:hypothetical protein
MLILFQLLLLAVLVTLIVLYIRLMRTQLWDRILVLAAAVILGVFFFVPDLATAVANEFGIGRGSDLLFYLGHAFTALLILLLNARRLEQQRQIETLARTLALAGARPRPEGGLGPSGSGSGA